MLDLVILFKHLNNLLNVSEWLSKIKLYAPVRRFKAQDCFLIPYRRTYLDYNSPCHMLQNFIEYGVDTINLYVFVYHLRLNLNNYLFVVYWKPKFVIIIIFKKSLSILVG